MYGKDLVHLEFFSEIPVEELTSEDIDAWLNRAKEPLYPKPPSRTSFRREVKTLRTILNWFKEYKNPRYQNPYLRRHLQDAVFIRKVVRAEKALTWEKLERFWLRLKTHHKPVYFYLASYQGMTGARIGEACGLQWDCVDLERGRAEIRRTIWWNYRTKEPRLKEGTKNGEDRIVLLPARLVDLLRERKATGAKGSFVFHSEGEPLHYPAVQNAYNKALKAEGFPQRSTHFLRHTFAKLHADQTKNKRATQAALSHRTAAITDHYARANEETQESAIADFLVGKVKPVGQEVSVTLQ
ncbi:MAG TPA: site-specific integrase [Bdellovibrionota bacterium]|nr:site-specific integrase [Bdellovibrionota bacterium]